MQWAHGLSAQPDERIEQATYNVFSDMGVEPRTPSGIAPDRRRSGLLAAGPTRPTS
jgi:hypothetical protein